MSIRLAEQIPHVESEKEFNYNKLNKIADDIHADISFYEGVHDYILRFPFPKPELLDILVYRDCVSGEEIFPTKESALAYLKDKVETLKRHRDAHNRLAQIVLRVEAEQEENVEEKEVEVIDPPKRARVEAIDVDGDSSSSFSFDTQ
jgi:hypothetical protein